MSYFKRPLGLFLLLAMVLMALEVATKKPLCINSSLVNKIDRLSVASKLETIYTCNAYRNTAFSSFFYKKQEELNRRIGKIEILLRNIGLKGQVEVVIDSIAVDTLSAVAGRVIVGENNFANLNFESAIVQAILQQNIKFKNQNFSIFLAELLTQNFSEESIFGEIWQQAAKKLSPIENLKFHALLRQQLKNMRQFDMFPMTENILFLVDSNSHVAVKFKTGLLEQFKNYGLALGDINFKFNLIVEAESINSLNVQKLVQDAKLNSQQRTLLVTKEGQFVLPYLAPLPVHDYVKATTDMRLILVENENKKILFKKYFTNTEKLILLKTNFNSKDIVFSSLLAANSQKFLLENEKFNFIQLHIPSFKFRLGKNVQISSFSQLVNLKNSAKFKEKSLGWSNEHWTSESKAFKPVALYDVIQYYRLN